MCSLCDRGFTACRPSRKLKEEPKRLHPLHSVEFITSMIQNTGCYPDVDRCTGRSTILALEFIVMALKAPYQVVVVKDHLDTTMSHQRLCADIHDMANKLGLKKLFVNSAQHRICFGQPA